MHYFFPYKRNSSWKGQMGMEDRLVLASPDHVSIYLLLFGLSLNANKAYVIALYVCNSGFKYTNTINSNQHVIKLALIQ